MFVLIPYKKPPGREDFSEQEGQAVCAGYSPVSSALPEKSEVNGETGFFRGVLSLVHFFARAKKVRKEITEEV